MRYDQRTPSPALESALARAKNTSRSEARRRTRDAHRSVFTTDETLDESAEPAEVAVQEPRRSLFRMPDVRGDLRALPSVFMSRRLIWLPLALLVGGFVLILVTPGLSPEIQSITVLYLQFFFVPPALFTFFIAGFVSPRASYLVGLIYGLIAGIMWSIVLLVSNTDIATGAPTAAPTVNSENPLGVFGQMILVGALYGTLAAAFAAWYRDFLRQMQQRGATRRADQEARMREQRRTERQEARKTAKRTS